MKLWLEQQRQRGTALIEFAFVLPILLAFIVGVIYYGYAFTLKAAVIHAAKQGVQVAVSIDPIDYPRSFDAEVERRVDKSVRNSLSWLPDNIGRRVKSEAPPLDRTSGRYRITVTLPLTGDKSPLLPQIHLPFIGDVPPLPKNIVGVAEVVL